MEVRPIWVNKIKFAHSIVVQHVLPENLGMVMAEMDHIQIMSVMMPAPKFGCGIPGSLNFA